MCMDCASCLFSLIHIFGEVNDSFSMSRVGSITSEHQFSQMRFHAGKEQTIRSLRYAFDRIMIMRDLGDFFKVKIEKRMFRCAKIEDGIAVLSQSEINFCKETAFKISCMSGIMFPRECEFYELVSEFDTKHADTFNSNDYLLLTSLLNDDFETKGEQKKKCWRLQSSRFRIGPAKIGRNISMRYISALRNDCK